MTDPITPATPEPTPYTAAPGAPVAKTPILSVLSLVAGIIGVLGFAIVFIPFVGSFLQLFFPAAAIVLGVLGKRKEPLASKGLWLTGIILGIVGIVIAIIAAVAWGLLFATAGSYDYGY